MFNKIREVVKMFKGVKSMIIIRCDNCESIDTKLYNETLKSEIIEINQEKFKKVSYDVRCNKCNSLGFIEEIWQIKQ